MLLGRVKTSPQPDEVAVRKARKSSSASSNALCVAHEQLKTLSGWLGSSYDVSLPVPEFETLKHVKQFCSGLLDPSVRDHPWSRPIRSLKLRDRLSISGSLFLFRKILPSEKPDLFEYSKEMSIPAPDPPIGFIKFCTGVLNDMFPLGWDKGWKGKVLSTTVTTSSTLESVRKVGGGRSLLGNGFLDREEFCKRLLDKYTSWIPKVNVARVALAPCDGKFRRVTINSVEMTAIQPLHSLLYDRCTQQKWCLRGDANTSRMSDFVQVDGEEFVSGDYESATDNLNLDVARHILGVILRNCTRVPVAIREGGMNTLGGSLLLPDGSQADVRRGQLMGNALSFPLLCLQNYLAFKFIVKRDIPVLINGDDIVFRSRPDEREKWFRTVGSCGLRLSLGKTMVHPRSFSLNSTFFVAGTRHVRLAPVIRSTSFFKKLECPLALTGRIRTLAGFSKVRRDFFTSQVLRRHAGAVWWSRRSLRRGFGIRVSEEALRLSGLYRRECHYLSLPIEKPFPSIQVGFFKSKIPEGWTKVRTLGRRETPKEFFQDMVSEAWNPEKCSDRDVDWLAGTSPCVLRNFKSSRIFSLCKALGFGRSIGAFKRWGIPRHLPKEAFQGHESWVKIAPAKQCVEEGVVCPEENGPWCNLIYNRIISSDYS